MNPWILEHRISAIWRRFYVEEAAEQAIRMKMQMMPAIGVGDIRPHVRDVVRVSFHFVDIKNVSGFGHDQINQLLHLRKKVNVV